MVAYNFPHHEARAIIMGEKAACLRGPRKNAHAAVDGPVTCFVGNVAPDWSKSPDCHRLIDAPCVRSAVAVIHADGLILDGSRVTNPEFLRQLAKEEGHADWRALRDRVARNAGLPWHGHYIRWSHAQATYRNTWPLPDPQPPPEDNRL